MIDAVTRRNGGDLAKLSFDVAIELDKLLHHEPADRAAIQQFIDSLQSGVGVGTHADVSCLYANLPAIDLYGRAWDHLRGRLENVDDLKRNITTLLERVSLEDSPDERPETAESLAELKRFCLALHEELMSEKLNARLDKDTVPRGDALRGVA